MHVTVWVVMGLVCMVLAAISLAAGLLLERRIEATTWFTVADLLVCAAAIYVALNGGQFSELLPTWGLAFAILAALGHITYTWIRSTLWLLLGWFRGGSEEEPDISRPSWTGALLARVLERVGVEGRVDRGDVEAARRVVEVCRRWGWE
ncbi:MAG: hypothetical protein ABGY09_06170 [Euryarchaeota archaeon]